MKFSDIIEGLRNPSEIKDFRAAHGDEKINRLVHSHAAHKNPPWKKSLVGSMRKYGFDLIGAGVNGAVFQNPAYPFVLKVYRKDRGYDEWLHFAMTNRANPYVPQIRGNIVRLNKVFQAVRVEPLGPCNVAEANALTTEIERVGDLLRLWPPAKMQEALANEDPNVIALAKFMRDWEGIGDLTAHNIMTRANGQMVIIDPLWEDPDLVED